MKKKLTELFTKPAARQEQESVKDTAPQAEEVEKEAKQELPAEDGDKLRADVSELLELFPKLKAKAIPDEVWDRVREGDSLCAAYCLWTVKNAKEQLRIRDVNDKTARTAPPPVSDKGEGEAFFSRETVKNMSPEQVRKNFKAILDSMDRWK